MTKRTRKSKLKIKDVFGVLRSRYKVGAMAHLGDAVLGKAVLAEGWAFDLTMRRAGVQLTRWISRQVALLREAGFENFGMNLLFAENNRLDKDVNLILRLKPRWVTISAVATLENFKDLVIYARKFKDAGIYFGVLIGSAKQFNLLLKILPKELWPDFVILEGRESGGHNGPCSLLELLRTALPIAKKNGILAGAAGGIGNAEMVRFVFSLGVDFIQIGSPLVIAEECSAHPDCKRTVCTATTTVQTGSGPVYRHAVRTIPTPGALRLLSYQNDGMGVEEFIGKATGTIPAGMLGGDSDGVILIGEGVPDLKKVRPAAKILREFIVEKEPAEVA